MSEPSNTGEVNDQQTQITIDSSKYYKMLQSISCTILLPNKRYKLNGRLWDEFFYFYEPNMALIATPDG